MTGADGNKLYTDAVKAEEKFAITSQPSDVDVTNTNEIVAFKVISGSLAVMMEPAGSQQDLQEVVHQK